MVSEAEFTTNSLLPAFEEIKATLTSKSAKEEEVLVMEKA